MNYNNYLNGGFLLVNNVVFFSGKALSAVGVISWVSLLSALSLFIRSKVKISGGSEESSAITESRSWVVTALLLDVHVLCLTIT